MIALAYLAFVGALFAASRWLPGREHAGAAKTYKLNGLTVFLLTALIVSLGTWFGPFRLAWIAEHFFGLFVTANIFALVFSLMLYVKSPIAWKAEANPSWFGVDLKMFSYRPSLIGFALINVSFAALQYQKYGAVTARMWLYQVFTLLYLANYFQFESGMLFTWDILEERFGFMLVWGDYVFVPFFYSLPCWYLLNNREPLGAPLMVGLATMYGLGFWMFRGANGQKHRFKQNPQTKIWGKPAESIGGKLLVSGFWGIGRKLNYTGELLMYYAWTLPCGFGSVVPYLVPLWLTLFFPHRAWRDDQRCRSKYGPLWQEYCDRSRFRMIPFLY